MTSKPIYFCVYRITNLVEKKHYYGYKSSAIHPSKVVGITYFSSSTDKSFKNEQKSNPQNYKYKIVQLFDTKEKALAREIRLHAKFDVKNHLKFYNKANQTSDGFNTTGTSMSLESRMKMSLVRKGVAKSKAHKLAMSGRKHTQEEIDKISNSLTGLIKSKKHREKLAEAAREISHGSQNNNFKNYYNTPLGIVESPSALVPVISRTTLYRWCMQCDNLITENTFKRVKWLNEHYNWCHLEGKTFRELGFYVS